jgi:hypothetical protein
VADDLIVGAGFSDNVQCSLDQSSRRIKMIRFVAKAQEELHDLKNDPFEAKNLATSPSAVQAQALSKLRAELDKLKP